MCTLTILAVCLYVTCIITTYSGRKPQRSPVQLFHCAVFPRYSRTCCPQFCLSANRICNSTRLHREREKDGDELKKERTSRSFRSSSRCYAYDIRRPTSLSAKCSVLENLQNISLANSEGMPYLKSGLSNRVSLSSPRPSQVGNCQRQRGQLHDTT